MRLRKKEYGFWEQIEKQRLSNIENSGGDDFMQSFRKRMAIQKQHEPKRKQESKPEYRVMSADTKFFLIRAITIYRAAAACFELLSSEEELCRKIVLQYEKDLEILVSGIRKEGEEVIKKYGRDIC